MPSLRKEGGNTHGMVDDQQPRSWADHCRFGTVSLLLQLVPVLNMLFLLTTACGSALWVAKLERQQRLGQGRHSDEPDYTDDPV